MYPTVMPSIGTFRDAWNDWHAERLRTLLAPDGPAALVGTHWLSDEPAKVGGLPGLWSVSDDAVVVSSHDGELRDDQGEAAAEETRLLAGQHVWLGEKKLVAFDSQREAGPLALRVFDPQSPSRRSLIGVTTFPADPRWVLNGEFRAVLAATVTIPSVDGNVDERQHLGQALLWIDGRHVELTVIGTPPGPVAVFSDATSGPETYGFRFAAVQIGMDGSTCTIDFNRAEIPPCAFSDHFLCPMPPPGNRLPVAIPAGEKSIRRTD